MPLLHFAARHARWCLILGLLAGLALPGVAATLRPWLPHMVSALLFLTAFRLGPRAVLAAGAGWPSLSAVLVLQLVLPLVVLLALLAFGLATSPFALAVVLMLSAPSITGTPNFAIMTGHDPALAMRVLVLGTALFPLTVIPVIWLLPIEVGALAAGARLIAVILGAVGAGLLARHLAGELSADGIRGIDGATALLLGVLVVGLMSAIGPLLRDDPWRLASWLVAVICMNFGLQLATFALLLRRATRWAVPLSMIAGNRNIALFLVALPAATTDPLLIFIGCYQVPMYLTPLLLKPLHDLAQT
ncbi:hypothetical protein [Aestuariicoccus sp. MJ-SS9]|uniref:hypothetical protein n=1 Tax=Aestuariicoccus sp. MJ-SS9 TaxID=3079855 RepID=UPI002915829B|nr:hypothetical protein [Aestuariicoccus sp. MJ-SS9]MDU8912987.1 hypothetical protein [Aestuariicoccus sp. MJ-SS9]